EDWRWLRDQALGEWKGNCEAWGYALWLATRAREAEQLTEDEWHALVGLVDQHAPGLRDAHEEGRRRHEQELAEEEARRREREARDPARRPLADRVGELLDRPGLSARARMLEVGWLCFDNLPAVRPSGGTTWIDLP